MKPKLIFILLIVALLLVRIPAVQADPQAYNLSWWTVDGGGETSTSPGYSLSGTIGQPDAGQLGSGSFQVSGGFWGWVKQVFEVYLPLVMKN
jgi:hypothetical protein